MDPSIREFLLDYIREEIGSTAHYHGILKSEGEKGLLNLALNEQSSQDLSQWNISHVHH